MMTAERLAEHPIMAAPLEVRCPMCGGWIATVPAGTLWARGRCYNRIDGRACRLYGKGQTVHLR